jgi:DNA mismatch repair protein MutS2
MSTNNFYKTASIFQTTRYLIYQKLKLLSIPGAILAGDELIEIRKLAELMKNIFRWFDAERRSVYNSLIKIIDGTYYEKAIIEMIDDIIDESGQVKDNASDELQSIRMNLYRKRNELRRAFDRIISN